MEFASADGMLYNKTMTHLVQCPAGKSGSVTLPSGLITIGEWAFDTCHSMTDLTIPSGVVDIGTYAFADCSALSSISLPNTVVSMGEYTFMGCSGLSSATISNSLTYIPAGAFENCHSLSSIVIPGGVASIGDSAFSSTGLASVTFPSSVTSIGYGAFYDCNALPSVSIPSGVTSVSLGAFAACANLTSINVDAANPNYASMGGILYNKSLSTLIQCPAGLVTAVVPSNVTHIGDSAFDSCSSLTRLEFNGNAPSCGSGWRYGTNSTLLIVYYHSGATGFSNPWQGLQTVEIKGSSGADNTALYVGVAVAIVAVIAIAVLLMRRKKQA
jgi:hypothetical protein